MKKIYIQNTTKKNLTIKNKNFITKKPHNYKKKIIESKTTNLKLKKKWRFWRTFKQYFINTKKITFYKKLQWNFNEKRIIWHQLINTYLPKVKSILKRNLNKKFIFFLNSFELRLPVILLRSKFYTKLINSYEGVKKNLITVNGVIVNKNMCMLYILDLYQKKRQMNVYLKKKKANRIIRFKWRKFRWKKAKYLFWKIRRASNFNLYLNKKINSNYNYLEINYKIPAGVVIKRPFLKEFLINKQKNIMTQKILKKIFFIY